MIVAGTAGGAGARAVYDASNADKVDGFHAVGAGVTPAQKAGKLVAADSNGRVPDSARLGGFNHAQMSTISIPPQAAQLSDGATMSLDGPTLPDNIDGVMTVSFVVPPDHKPTTPLTMTVLYEEGNSDACAWYVTADGQEGPDGPSDSYNEFNGAWNLAGTSAHEGLVSVPAGIGTVHSTSFQWASQQAPGTFVQFHLTRATEPDSDTCGYIGIRGLQVSY